MEIDLTAGSRDGNEFLVFETLSENIGVTPEGYLLCKHVAISKAGVFPYRPDEIPEDIWESLGKPTEQIEVERPISALNSAETIGSFEGKPITFYHPHYVDGDTGEVDILVRPHTWKDSAVGNMQNIEMGTGTERDRLFADLLITDSEAIDAVRSGRIRQVSAGATPNWGLSETPGRATHIYLLGNHVALVEEGRCGSACAIVDHAINKVTKPMKKSATKQKKSMKDSVAGNGMWDSREDLTKELKKENKAIAKSERNLNTEEKPMKKEMKDDDIVQMHPMDDVEIDETELVHDMDEAMGMMELHKMIRALHTKLDRLLETEEDEEEEMEDMGDDMDDDMGDDMDMAMMDESDDEREAKKNHETERQMENKEYRENQRHDKELTDLEHDLGRKPYDREERHMADALAPGLHPVKNMKFAALKHCNDTKHGRSIITTLLKGKNLNVVRNSVLATDRLFRAAATVIMGNRKNNLARASLPTVDHASSSYTKPPTPDQESKQLVNAWNKRNADHWNKIKGNK